MRVNVTDSRKNFFTMPTPASTLRQQAIEPAYFSSFQEVQELLNKEVFVSGATETHASAAINGQVTSQSVVRAASSLRDGQILVLPSNAYVSKSQAHNLRNYDTRAFPDVEWVAAGREFTQNQRFSGWTDQLRIQYQATPNRLLPHAVGTHSSDTMNNPLMGYRFGDNTVEWSHVFMGSELRVWHSKWRFFQEIEDLESQLRTLKKGVSGKQDQRIRDIRQLIDFNEYRIQEYGLDEEEYRLADAGHRCLDDVLHTSDTKPTLLPAFYGANKRVFSPNRWSVDSFQRKDPDQRRKVFFDKLPVVPSSIPDASAALVHKIGASTYSLNEKYGNMAGRGAPWISEAVAALHTLSRVFEKVDSIEFYNPQMRCFGSGNFVMGEVPFPIPKVHGTQFADTIRYDTVFLDYDPISERINTKTTNLGTLSKLIGCKLSVDGFHRSLAVNKHELYAQGEDPMRSAVTVSFDGTSP